MSASSSAAASSASSFHFSPPTLATTMSSPLHSPISPLDPTHDLAGASPPRSLSHSPHHPFDADLATPLFAGSSTSSSSPRPPLSGRANSYATHHHNHNNTGAYAHESDDASERQRRVSYAGHSFPAASNSLRDDDALASTSSIAAGIWAVGAGTGQGAAARSAEDQYQGRTGTVRTFGSGSSASGQGDAAQQHQQMHYQQQLARPPFLPSVSTFSHQSMSTPLSSPSLPSPPPLAPQMASLQAQAHEAHQAQVQANDPRASPSLHLGDLDVWMDEAYVRECCARMGWDGVSSVKMIRGTSPSSGYCFLTFPSVNHAAQVLARFNAAPPTLMPRSSRTFKLNWGTGLPGVQPRWEGEYSVFVGDLGREVGEAELVSLFTPLFPSTKSAKIMYDPSTSLSRGYGFVRFADESDMQRALVLGQNAGSGLSLHGRTLRISEASGPGNDSATRERTRSASRDGGLSVLTNGSASGAFQYPAPQHEAVSPTSPYSEYLSPTFPVPHPLSPTGSQFAANPLSPTLSSRNGPISPAFQSPTPLIGNRSGPNGGGGGGGHSHTTDPNNTTVFVGGLPACISEETLKSFFHHFGEITYCKIPTGKGCGFVQFVRRADAELAIAKMNDFPIHGKSRIRLSWGRSQGDKQVEHVRKLASALGVPFEAVWRMVQGQDNTTIKQIATAVGGTPVLGGRFENLGVGRMELGAVASAAGLTEAEVLDLVGGRASDAFGGSSSGQQHLGPKNLNAPGPESDFYVRSAASPNSLDAGHANGHGPYSRVSPSTFSAFAASPTPAQGHLPLSPPPSGSAFAGHGNFQQQQPLAHQHPGYGPPSPYTAHRPDSYLVHSPPSPYAPVQFHDGGVPNGGRGRFPNQGTPYRYDSPRYSQQPPIYHQHAPAQYFDQGGPSLDESFQHLGLHQSTSGPPPPHGYQASSQQSQPEFFQPASNGPKYDDARSRSYLAQGAHSHGAHWGWQGDVSA